MATVTSRRRKRTGGQVFGFCLGYIKLENHTCPGEQTETFGVHNGHTHYCQCPCHGDDLPVYCEVSAAQDPADDLFDDDDEDDEPEDGFVETEDGPVPVDEPVVALKPKLAPEGDRFTPVTTLKDGTQPEVGLRVAWKDLEGVIEVTYDTAARVKLDNGDVKKALKYNRLTAVG